MQHQRAWADRKMVITRKNKVHGPAIGAHPLRGQAGRFTRAHVPIFGEVHGRPRPPWLRGVVDTEAALEPRSLWMTTLGKDLHPQVTLERRTIRHTGAIASAGVGKDRAALRDVLRPSGSPQARTSLPWRMMQPEPPPVSA